MVERISPSFVQQIFAPKLQSHPEPMSITRTIREAEAVVTVPIPAPDVVMGTLVNIRNEEVFKGIFL
jgi:hypothetical protein